MGLLAGIRKYALSKAAFKGKLVCSAILSLYQVDPKYSIGFSCRLLALMVAERAQSCRDFHQVELKGVSNDMYDFLQVCFISSKYDCLISFANIC